MAIKKERNYYVVRTNNGLVQIDLCLLDYENLSDILKIEEYRNNTIDEIIFDFRYLDKFIERRFLSKDLIFEHIAFLRKIVVSEDVCFLYQQTLSSYDNVENVDLCYLGVFENIKDFGLDVMNKVGICIDYSNFSNTNWRDYIIKTIGNYACIQKHCFLKEGYK